MNIDDYKRYVKSFNSRDYDKLTAFFTEDVVLEVSSMTIKSKQGIRDFYETFFHVNVSEEVTSISQFFEGAEASFANVIINFKGINEVTQEMLDERGYGRMTPIPAGGEVDLEYFILYYNNPDGLIYHIKAAVFEPALTV